MKNTIKETKTVEHISSVQCDVCGVTYDDPMDIQEFHFINFVGGYNSIFGDMTRVEADICQNCLKGMLQGVAYRTEDIEP